MAEAWAALEPYVRSVARWVMSFFTTASGENFDIVRMWIENIGKAWDALTLPIKTVIRTVRQLWNAYTTMYQKAKQAVERTKNVFTSLWNKVKSVVNSIISKVKSITDIDISDVINKIVQPFKDAYDKVCKEVDKIKDKVREIPSNVGSAGLGVLGAVFNAGFDIEGMLEAQSTNGGKSEMDINLNVDLSNVPANIDTQTLIAVLTDPTVLQALTGNNNFQSLDQRAKNRYNLKQARAGGI